MNQFVNENVLCIFNWCALALIYVLLGCTSDLCGLLDRCTEKEIHEVADAMVSSGMRDAGYECVLI